MYRGYFFDDTFVLDSVADDVEERRDEGEKRQEQHQTKQNGAEQPRIITHYNTHRDTLSSRLKKKRRFVSTKK